MLFGSSRGCICSAIWVKVEIDPEVCPFSASLLATDICVACAWDTADRKGVNSQLGAVNLEVVLDLFLDEVFDKVDDTERIESRDGERFG